MVRVLIADDERRIRELLVDTIVDVGYDVIEASNGSEALKKAFAERPDVILLDVMMPVMDGFEVLRKLKETATTKDIPVILITAMSAREGEHLGLVWGVEHYITKPWEPGMVEAAIRVALREAETEPEENTGTQMLTQQLASMEGVVSIMFTDLEGSTELLTRLGDEENQALLRTHNSIIRQQVAKHSGLEVKTLGDGFMIVFSSARRAGACAVDIQLSLQNYNKQNADRPLKVRIGINIGETIKEEKDFFGSAVVTAARIAAEASGGKILVSDLFRQLTGQTSELRYKDHGRKKLKGFTEKVHLYEIDWRASDR